MKPSLTRRKFLMGGAAISVAGCLIAVRPSDAGASNHDDYFLALSDALKKKEEGKPVLVVDKKRLDKNIELINQSISNKFNYRIVTKSLPSIDMLAYIMVKANTNRLMVFHQPFLTQIAQRFPQADILMGKPLPIKAVKAFYERIQINQDQFDDEASLQWLVDSFARLEQHQALAASLKKPMRINIELDVGLHRGGVNHDDELIKMLDLIASSNWLSFSGFMGYEPHIGKVPGSVQVQRDQAMELYHHKINITEAHLGRSIDDLTLNAAGSTTYQYYSEGSFPMNELSAGSCLVKPCDFDLDSLKDHIPACYIAAPVLKALSQTKIPSVSSLGRIMSYWNPNLHKAFFIYGGYWKAVPESPQGLTLNPVYGRSSNQEMLNGSNNINLKQDDWVFLRPTQSESVFLQFGDILVYDKGTILDNWPIMLG